MRFILVSRDLIMTTFLALVSVRRDATQAMDINSVSKYFLFQLPNTLGQLNLIVLKQQYLKFLGV